MAKIEMPSIERIRQLIEYDPATGILLWRPRDIADFEFSPNASDVVAGFNAHYAGKPALNYLNNDGYYRGRVLKKSLLSHRAAFAIFHDCWPIGQIDHANGVRTDNRIANLSDVSPAENNRNAKRRPDCTSGITGVSFIPSRNKWVAYVSRNGTRHQLGVYDCFDAAVAARQDANIMMGFSLRHGSIQSLPTNLASPVLS